MIERSRSEKGFTLVAVMALALLATFAAFAVLTLFRHETRTLQSTNVRDRLESVLDTGLEKTILKLNETGGWTSLSTTAYFSSLTATGTAFTDVNGYQYWVKVLAGKRAQPVPGAINDTIANNLTDTGDTNLNRTVLIRARNVSTTVELRAMALLHRSDVSPIIPIGGIYAPGIDLGNSWDGDSYDSCSGVTRTSQTPGCDGSATGITVTPAGASATWCLTISAQTNFQPYPTVVIPSGTVPLPGNTLVTQNYSVPNPSVTLGPGPIKYQCANFTATGSRDVIINTSGSGPVEIYVTGAMSIGTGNITSPPLSPGGSPPEAIFYVTSTTDPASPGASASDWSVDFSGSGNFEIMLIAPRANVRLSGGANFYGAIVAQNFKINGGGTGGLHFDKCILQMYKANTYPRPPIITLGWSQF